MLCIHGIPASSFLYRKLLPELAARELRGVAFDLPGLGLAERPVEFDYDWSGLGAWCAAAVDALGLDRFHLVVHDFGGPVGFELCARMPRRVLSLTILNTAVDVEHFHRPRALELLARPRLSVPGLKLLPRSAFRALMWRVGIADRSSTSDAELDAWLELLRREDGGRACVRMATGLERTRAKSELELLAEGLPVRTGKPQGTDPVHPPTAAAGGRRLGDPPPDNCAGYLGTPTPTDRISLIRMPHVATYFDTEHLTPTTRYEQNEADFISFTQYGSAIGVYRPGTPYTTSLGDAELEIDDSGGSTILVWPRDLAPDKRRQVFAYARQHGFAIMRGGAANQLTTANLLIRMKGASPTYRGAYAPDADRKGVPCYFGTVQDPSHAGKPWSTVTGAEFAASPSNLGPGAPQGVSGDPKQLLDGSLLNRLKDHIRSTGGNYSAR